MRGAQRCGEHKDERSTKMQGEKRSTRNQRHTMVPSCGQCVVHELRYGSESAGFFFCSPGKHVVSVSLSTLPSFPPPPHPDTKSTARANTHLREAQSRCQCSGRGTPAELRPRHRCQESRACSTCGRTPVRISKGGQVNQPFPNPSTILFPLPNPALHLGIPCALVKLME